MTTGLCGLVSVLVGLASAGYHGHHSDLAIQRTLVRVRRAPGTLPDDLVADHALAHPGWLFDLLAVLPDAPVVELGVHLVLLALVGMGIAHAGRALGIGRAGVLLAAALVVLPRALLAESRLVHAAPLARNLATVLQLWGLAAALRGRSLWSGVAAGLALGAHVPTGVGAVPVLGAVLWSQAPDRRAALRVHLGVAAAVGGAVLLPWALVGGAAPVSGLQARLLALRSGHHLDVLAWDPGGAAAAVLHLILGLGAWRQARSPAVLAAALAAGGVVVVGALARPQWWPQLSRLHLGYAASWWAVIAILGAAWRWGRAAGVADRARALAWVLPLLLCVENTLVDELPGGGWAWRLPSRSGEDEVPPRRHCIEDPWVRVREGRPVYLSLKDGGEAVGDPVFAARWAHRLQALCGPAVLAERGAESRGWRAVAARCKHVPRCDGRPR